MIPYRNKNLIEIFQEYLLPETEPRLTLSPSALYKKQLFCARSSMDRAPDYGSGGYRFKSCRARHVPCASQLSALLRRLPCSSAWSLDIPSPRP